MILPNFKYFKKKKKTTFSNSLGKFLYQHREKYDDAEKIFLEMQDVCKMDEFESNVVDFHLREIRIKIFY